MSKPKNNPDNDGNEPVALPKELIPIESVEVPVPLPEQGTITERRNYQSDIAEEGLMKKITTPRELKITQELNKVKRSLEKKFSLKDFEEYLNLIILGEKSKNDKDLIKYFKIAATKVPDAALDHLDMILDDLDMIKDKKGAEDVFEALDTPKGRLTDLILKRLEKEKLDDLSVDDKGGNIFLPLSYFLFVEGKGKNTRLDMKRINDKCTSMIVSYLERAPRLLSFFTLSEVMEEVQKIGLLKIDMDRVTKAAQKVYDKLIRNAHTLHDNREAVSYAQKAGVTLNMKSTAVISDASQRKIIEVAGRKCEENFTEDNLLEYVYQSARLPETARASVEKFELLKVGAVKNPSLALDSLRMPGMHEAGSTAEILKLIAKKKGALQALILKGIRRSNVKELYEKNTYIGTRIPFSPIIDILYAVKRTNIELDMAEINNAYTDFVENYIKYGVENGDYLFSSVPELLRAIKKAGISVDMQRIDHLSQKLFEAYLRTSPSEKFLKFVFEDARKAGINIHLPQRKIDAQENSVDN
ncbi:MAG: hypothetical protein Q8P62_00970 [Candidatus Peregrinibacteria bacterium]|nr:hypothetical protein [Candidatus Peregrinibacteria bacterium]